MADTKKDASTNGAASAEAEKQTEEKPVVEEVVSIEDEVLNNITLIGRAVSTIEPRFTIRVLRTLTSTRKRLDKDSLKAVLNKAFPKGSKTGQQLIASTIFDSLPATTSSSQPADEGMQIDPAPAIASMDSVDKGAHKADAGSTGQGGKKYTPPVDPQSGDLILEATTYLRLLLALLNLDAGKVDETAKFLDETTEILAKANRRTMDQIAAKVYFYLALAFERQGRLQELQPRLLAVRQTASLRNDETLEGTVLNIVVRSYIQNNQYDQAANLMAKTEYRSEINQSQTVRWLYYLARVRAVQLDYAAANRYLSLCIRRAPKDSSAPGFIQAIHKLYIVVELLTGVIPDRALFRKPVLKNALQPYFQIVQAVRVGDMTGFQKALTTHDATFTADDNHFLILRLRHFVIKTALRTITLAYSRISIRDICVKLNLDSEEETEYIVAKAIRDGVIEATIDHASGFMQSRVARNVYETDEPQTQLTRRTAYLQNMYTETVRAMRFPPNAHRKELESAAEVRERDREIAQMIDENEADDDDMEM